MPQAESHKSVDSASQGGHSWPIANWEQRYATYLQREIRTVPVRPARAQSSRRREPWGARRPVPIEGRWRFAVVGRDRPATHAWAWVAGS